MKLLAGCVLTGVLVAGLLLAFTGESESERNFRVVFGVDAPKTEADRIRTRPIVARRLERAVQRVATFAIAHESARRRPLSPDETEQARKKTIGLLRIGSEVAIQELYWVIVLAREFRVLEEGDLVKHREAKTRGDESRPIRGRLALFS